MRWCNTFGVGRNPNKFGEDVIIDLGITPEDVKDDSGTEIIASIRLDKEGVENLIRTLQRFISE